MRQIKFRAMLSDKYYAHPRMVPWGELLESFDALHIFDEDCMTLMQYTGLHDKNGREIYEDDILTVWMNPDDDALPAEQKGVVKFRDGSFYLDCDGFTMFDWPTHLGYVTVIGNIFENPELLEAEK